MTAVEILPSRQKQLIGVGASIAAGCQPCTSSFAAAAREAGACERGVRFAVESGLAARDRATAGMSAFAEEKLAHPQLDAAFRADRKLLDALIGVAGAVAGNAASLLGGLVEAARGLGATDDQLRLVAELGRKAKRGAERQTDAALAAALGGTAATASEVSAAACACGCGEG